MEQKNSLLEDRIIDEFDEYQYAMSQHSEIGFIIETDDNFVPNQDFKKRLVATFHGLANTYHEGAIYKMEIFIPPKYPYSNPQFRFLKPLPYNPWVQQTEGRTGYPQGSICLPVYTQATWNNEKWLYQACQAIILLICRDPPEQQRSFLAPEIYEQFFKEKDTYIKNVKQVVKESKLLNLKK